MCDPVSISTTALVAGTAASAYGQLQAGAAEAQTANANAALLRERARDIEEKAKYDIAQIKREFVRSQGANVSKIAANNLNVATFADVLADDAMEAFLEQKAVRHGAEIEKHNLKSQALITQQQGQAAQSASYISAIGTVAGGISRGVTMRNSFESTGLGLSDRLK